MARSGALITSERSLSHNSSLGQQLFFASASSRLQFLTRKRILLLCAHFLHVSLPPLYVGIHFSLMLVVIGKCRMNLGHRKMWVLLVHLLGTPAVGDLVEHDFDDLRISPNDP